MNSFERIRAVIQFREYDRVPVIPEMIGVTATIAGVSPRDYVRSGQVMADCQLEALRKIKYDAVFAIADLCVEAEALGCSLFYPEDNYPYVKKIILHNPGAIKKIGIPNPHSDGRLPEILKAVRILKQEVGGSVPVFAHVIGPITLAARIMDVEKMLYLIVDNPDKFRDLLNFCQQVSTTFAMALVEEGADGIIMFDSVASPSVLPPKIFKEFELNPVRTVFAKIKEMDSEVITWYSVAGPVHTNKALLEDVAADITTVDYMVPIDLAMKHSMVTVINGNIKPMLFQDGSEKEIFQNAITLLSATRPIERFILGSGCEIPLYSDIKKISVLVKAVKEQAKTFEYVNSSAHKPHEITIIPDRKKIRVSTGDNLLDVMHKAGIAITSYCDNSGSCGRCLIYVKKGKTIPPDKIEKLQLQSRDAHPNERLACCIGIKEPMEIYIPYFSRTFQFQNAFSDKWYEKSIGKELDIFGFKPNIEVKQLNLTSLSGSSTLSYEKRIAKQLNNYKIDPFIIGNFASLFLNKQQDINVIIDREKAEVIDFSCSNKIYGLAIDIGTTTISAFLHDLTTGELKYAGSIENPQQQWGFDIITRTTKIVNDPTMLHTQQDNLIEGINNLIFNFHHNHSISNNHIYEIAVVANPVMIHLLLGLSPESLAQSPFVPTVSQRVSISIENLRSQTKLAVNSRCRVEILPSIGCFVGADTVAGILATGIHKKQKISLFVDIGTNSEIVLGNRDRLICTSVPAGSAFEISHLTSGHTYQNGIITNIDIDPAGSVQYETTGKATPCGMSGSSTIDAIAEFLRHGIINRRGHLINRHQWPQIKNNVFILVPKQKTTANNPIFISTNDIEEIQKAKSAIMTGITLLINEMGIAQKDIRNIFISGSFGININIKNAITIGMLPDFPWAEFKFLKNSAGIGARVILLSRNARKIASDIALQVEHINLANHKDFFKFFIENMLFPAKL